MHGSFCFTNQKPNEDAQKKADYRPRPHLNLWVGSSVAAQEVAKYFRNMKDEGVKGFKVNIYSSFDSYYDSFRSDTGQNKPAPPRTEKTTAKKTKVKKQTGII